MSYYYLNLFNYTYRLKFQLAMNDVYLLCLRQNVTWGGGGGGGGGSGLDYVILLSEGGGWVLITVDYGGGRGVKNAKKLIT